MIQEINRAISFMILLGCLVLVVGCGSFETTMFNSLLRRSCSSNGGQTVIDCERGLLGISSKPMVYHDEIPAEIPRKAIEFALNEYADLGDCKYYERIVQGVKKGLALIGYAKVVVKCGPHTVVQFVYDGRDLQVLIDKFDSLTHDIYAIRMDEF